MSTAEAVVQGGDDGLVGMHSPTRAELARGDSGLIDLSSPKKCV